MSEFRDKTIAGILWSVTAQFGRQASNLVVTVILARLLTPRDFGLIAMVTVVTGFATVFAQLGFGSAIIHKQDVTNEHLSSVFWINVLTGIALTALFGLIAGPIGRFYGEPLVAPLVVLIGTTFVIRSLGSVQTTLLNKKIDFRAVAIVDFISLGVAGVVAIWMAYSDYGVWSLAVKTVVAALVSTIVLWVISSWRPTFSFHPKSVRELIGFSTHVLADQSLNYWVRNLDNLLIGKVIGSGALGLYSQAYSLMLFPLQNISSVVARVMFPSLATIQNDKPRVKRVFLKMTRSIGLVTFPLMLGLFVLAESFVVTVLGPQWIGMVPILRVFSILGLTQSIATLVGNLFLSQGRADLMFRVGFFVKIVIIAGIVIGLKWGAMGVAVGYAIASLCAFYPNFYFGGGLVGLRVSELIRDLSGILASALAMAVAVFLLGLTLSPHWSDWLRLATLVFGGVAIYWAIIHIFGIRAYREVLELKWPSVRQ